MNKEPEQVKVLISPGFGAGWSTWNDDEIKGFLLMDPTLVQMAEEKKLVSEVDEYISKTFPGRDYTCTLGWENIKVHTVDKGTHFRVTEKDGNETLQFSAQLEWFAA